MTQELDVLQILAAAVLVRYPFTGFARVVAIEHRRNRVDAQPVDVELLQPVQAAGEHEAMHLATTEVVDQRVPILMKTLARIFMLIQRGAIEMRKAMLIRWKVRGYPVEQHADIGGMRTIDEATQAIRITEPGVWREHAEWLIAPGAAEWVGHHRQQLDMREAHVGDVGNQLIEIGRAHV